MGLACHVSCRSQAPQMQNEDENYFCRIFLRWKRTLGSCSDTRLKTLNLCEQVILFSVLCLDHIEEEHSWVLVSNPYLFFLNFIYLFIYLFMAVSGLRFCARAFSSCGQRGPLFIAVRGPLTIAASLVAEHRLQTRRLSSCGARA